jgi:hypothetical protein
MHDTMTQLVPVDVSDPNSGQIEQNRRSVIQARGLSRLLRKQQQDFKRSRAPLSGAPHPGQNRPCPIKIEEPVSSKLFFNRSRVD